ncbi:MAG: bifunctional phosphopantothenoylcysteine decarboxylase/phosphopantothenate--cysteine ligase CoaBC [Deltaproteobacteria bacterium]|jgi:phosphopantothenoylcysteine decarboxylase/phosphopantothenate--cysteine ligase|nr:bifunctional phosphopantothenoylcysteine decarboxylase/phosphopantothenate--cysteine ligase CoaBC [Deltaproteobacteria bacterium]
MENYFPQTPFAGRRIHLGVTGSIAAYKALDLLRAFHKHGMRVSATLTESAARFVTPLSFKALGAETVYSAMFPGGQNHRDVDPAFDNNADVLGHLTPGAQADAFIILPASATTLARLAHGLADEILSAQALAFPQPLVLVPAMNPRMWANPATQANCAVLRSRGHLILDPDDGVVACNEKGRGKLTDLRLAYLAVLARLAPQDMRQRRLLLTLGPTREQWDGVRFWSNLSTGFMGACFAIAAFLRGAEVFAVCGPNCPWLPEQIKRIDVHSAEEMFVASTALWETMDFGIFAAAVADFYPEPFGTGKFKKNQATDELSIVFRKTNDILAHIGSRKHAAQKIVGFAAETSDLEKSVLDKLKHKNADLLVGNLVGVNKTGSGFATQVNQVFIADKQGKAEHWPTLPKADVAWRVLDWLLRL